MLIKTVLPIVLLFGSFEIDAKEINFVINGKKLTNVVSTQFVSYSIDLDDLFEGVNNGVSNVFVENLYPAFVRVVEFNNSFPLQKWIFIQEWFKKSQLVPIFTITSKFFKSNHLLPFLKVNEEMGVQCYWQLHYDCDNSPSEYKADLVAVKHLLNKVNTSSKLVSGSLRFCENVDAKLLVKDLNEIVDVYMWNSGFTNNDFVPVQNPIWLETPKTEQLGFHSVLVWAKRLGDTAKNSYNNVLFWSGRFSAVFDDTPMFWVSYLYKKLIGNGVLDITSNTFIKEDVEVTAYCAKEGAMIVTAANTDHNKFTASIKLAKIYFKKIKVQKYVVTSRNDGFTYLNEKKLSKKMLKTNFAEPDIETIETDGTFNLIVPAKSIIIIVLYDATVPACAFNPNEEKKFGSQIYPKMRKNEIVGNIKTLDDFRQFLIDNKIRTPKRTTKLEIVFAERPHVHNHSPNHTKEIELQLTNDEIKKILLDRAKNSVVETNEKQLEMEMKKAVKKLIKNTKTDHQTLKRLAKDRVRRDAFKRSPKSRDLIAHMAPVTMHGKKGDNSFEEEILKSGEKYVDERVRILTEPDTGNSELEKYRDNYFSENFGNVRIKRENAESNGKVPSEDVLGNIRKWQNRFNRPKKINSDIVSSKRNNKKIDMKLLKEKMENRKKMGDWIKKRHARPKRSLLNRNDVYVPKVRDIKSINPYVSKVLKEKWKPDDLRLIKRKPSYSIENLSQREFLPTLKRKQRKPRNTAEDFDLNDNEIDDESRNKIPKIGYVSSVPTQTSTISTYESVDTSNTSSYAIEEEDKGEHFFNSIVSNIKYFIENMYEKVSSYFTT